ncbi:MAG: hypothetical protein Ta2F_04450 [Termitinemataceae bacterium]|nr:MAG: hypothetical protein Ta2F_04450 [Termitinemataceae bacterium]
MINKTQERTKITFEISGKMDAVSSPVLESEIKGLSHIIKELIFDLGKVEFISSIGLRNVLLAFKTMKARNGKFSILNIPPQVKEIFEMSGFMNTFQRDEKLIIIEKIADEKSVFYSLVGVLDEETSINFEQKLFDLKPKKLESITFDCEKLTSITDEGCCALHNAQTFLGSSMTLLNTKKEVTDKVAASEIAKMLPDPQK